jgi:hypothetical protein
MRSRGVRVLSTEKHTKGSLALLISSTGLGLEGCLLTPIATYIAPAKHLVYHAELAPPPPHCRPLLPAPEDAF